MSKKLTPMSIRFDPDVKEALEQDAQSQERSMSWIANRILREHYSLAVAAHVRKRGKSARS